MNFLSGKHILVGVSGGIAAYKSAELVRLLRQAGARVRVMMTPAAQEFIGVRTLQALSGEPVWCDWSDDRSGMDHIELARWADRILVAPATADSIARLACGRADDLLATVCLASDAPLLLAPAMNQAMWRKAVTRDNVARLIGRGVRICGPDEGEQACGDVGPGRLLEPRVLCELLAQDFASGLLAGLRVLVTAGPTREAIDPVRYLSNRSSGKMGYAVAAAARQAGADVCLVSGPVALPAPAGLRCVAVESAQHMLDAVLGELDNCDIFIGAAAVADYRPAVCERSKIRKNARELTLELAPTVDILASVAAHSPRPFCVGFAAETEQLEPRAHSKRLRKGVDMIAANLVGEGLGFEVDDNALLLVWEGGQLQLPKDRKARLAERLIEHIAERYRTGTQHRSAIHHAEHSA
jgi:phosphopantothenoylcysteine decarboxylase/phosphopantothenate--cysteine ligase